MGRSNRLVLILGLLVILLIIVGYYFLLLAPLRAEYSARVQERSDKEAQLSDLQQQVNELEEVRSNAPEIERQLLELSKRIPSQPEIPTLIVQIKEVADAAGVTQLLIQPAAPEAPPAGGDYQVIPVTMEFEGTYEELQDFLLRTRQLARLVTVNEVCYEAVGALQTGSCVEDPSGTALGGEADVERLLQVELQMEVYFQPSGQAQRAAPAAPAAPEPTTLEETTGAEEPAGQEGTTP